MPDATVSAGEVGGIVAGTLAVLAAIGGAIKWVAGWSESRAQSRDSKFQRWEDHLDARERQLDEGQSAYTTQLEVRVAANEASLAADKQANKARDEQVLALRYAFEMVAGELRQKDPANRVLHLAEQLLEKAFPLPSMIPPKAMADALNALDEVPGAATDAGGRRKA